MMPSPPQSLVPLGVFNSSLAGAMFGFVFFLQADEVKLFEATSKPALPNVKGFASVEAVTVRGKRGVAAFSGRRARKADLLAFANVAICIHVLIGCKSKLCH